MVASFPFLAEMRLLAVQTVEPYQHVANPDAHDALLASQTTRYFDLPRIARGIFKDVLDALGAPTDIPDETVNAVYAFSGGHLALAGRCASACPGSRVTCAAQAGRHAPCSGPPYSASTARAEVP